MAKRSTKTARKGKGAEGPSYCASPEVPERTFDANVDVNRAALIRTTSSKCVNGTVLRYYFFGDTHNDGQWAFRSNGRRFWRTWATPKAAEKTVVRKAFTTWQDVGIGVKFEEVKSREDAEIRIGFMRGDGAWSYVGRGILTKGAHERTMNFGWDLTRRKSEIDTAVHEIGHTLGFPHEHQNPHAGIVWDEEAVYTSLAKPPNRWSRSQTHYNIIRKIEPDEVQGSNWDPHSIMHYPFEAGLIKEPERYGETGLSPRPGLSQRDRAWVKALYPPLKKKDYSELRPFESAKLAIMAGQQRNYYIKPEITRLYDIRTFGNSDTVMVLFEETAQGTRYMAGDDDGGEDYNARIQTKLFSGGTYILRIRLYYQHRTAESAVMLW